MGCSTYLIISLILFPSLVLSAVSAATGELPRQRYDERDSKFPYPDLFRYRYFHQRCYGYGESFFCPPPTAPTKPKWEYIRNPEVTK